jgi:hypothetical protein
MVEDGYVFSNHANCRSCKAEIEWWETPTKKKMPFDLMLTGNAPAITHFTTCPNADAHRKPR